MNVLCTVKKPGSVVSTKTMLRQGDQGFESRQGRERFYSQKVSGPNLASYSIDTWAL